MANRACLLPLLSHLTSVPGGPSPTPESRRNTRGSAAGALDLYAVRPPGTLGHRRPTRVPPRGEGKNLRCRSSPHADRNSRPANDSERLRGGHMLQLVDTAVAFAATGP